MSDLPPMLGDMNAAIALDIDQCAHCGLVFAEDQFLLVYCSDCSLEYCKEHAEPEEHHCRLIRDSGARQASFQPYLFLAR